MRLTKSVAHLKDRCPEHGFRPLKAGKMHPNALKTLPRSASAPQVYVVMLSSHLFMLRVQFCNTALTHRGVLGANRPSNEQLPPESQTNYRPRVGVHTPGAGHCRTGVGAMSRCPRFENASMYHILHAVSEEPVRISRSCLDGSKGSCGPATTLHALPPRSARLTAACELIERLARVQDLLLSYAGRFLPSGKPPPKTTASHRYQR